MSLFEKVQEFEDVAEEVVTVPQWGDLEVLFRGLTYAALAEMRNVDIEAAQNGDHEQAVRMVQATAYDPETGELAFPGEEGFRLLNGKAYAAILHLPNKGALVVLGVDRAETAGKDSSSAETEDPTPLD